MDTESRYIVAQARLNERYAEAARSRLIKGDGTSDARPVGVTGNTRSGLLGRLTGLRGLIRRPVTATAAASSH